MPQSWPYVERDRAKPGSTPPRSATKTAWATPATSTRARPRRASPASSWPRPFAWRLWQSCRKATSSPRASTASCRCAGWTRQRPRSRSATWTWSVPSLPTKTTYGYHKPWTPVGGQPFVGLGQIGGFVSASDLYGAFQFSLWSMAASFNGVTQVGVILTKARSFNGFFQFGLYARGTASAAPCSWAGPWPTPTTSSTAASRSLPSGPGSASFAVGCRCRR